MTYYYFLFDGTGGTPTGYTAITAYDGKYLRFSNSYAGFGSTGGSATHTHTTSSASVGTCGTYSDKQQSGSGAAIQQAHSHSAPTSYGGLSANNAPSYYTLQLIRIDMTTWENSYKKFPIGSILLASSTLSGFTELSRFTSADGKLIKLGTAGSTGGSATHTHTLTGTLQNNTSTYNSNTSSDYPAYPTLADSHNHTVSITTPSVDIMPIRIQTRMYKVLSKAYRAAAGCIAFADGNPSANWELVDWNGYFLQSVDSDVVTTGSSTHAHSSLSGTSSGHNPGTVAAKDANAINTANRPHYHSFSINMDSIAHTPEYVDLVPIRLKNTLLAQKPRSICVNSN